MQTTLKASAKKRKCPVTKLTLVERFHKMKVIFDGNDFSADFSGIKFSTFRFKHSEFEDVDHFLNEIINLYNDTMNA